MKKLISLLLAVATVAAVLAGCGGKPSSDKPALTDSVETILQKLDEKLPQEFGPAVMPLNPADTSEEGLFQLQSGTGLKSGEKIKEAALYESPIGSLAFSVAMVRTNNAADAKAVAEEMKAGIDPRKWVCVEADDVKVAGFGDVVMLVMVDTNLGLTAQSYVDAFQEICGAQLDFVI